MHVYVCVCCQLCIAGSGRPLPLFQIPVSVFSPSTGGSSSSGGSAGGAQVPTTAVHVVVGVSSPSLLRTLPTEVVIQELTANLHTYKQEQESSRKFFHSASVFGNAHSLDLTDQLITSVLAYRVEGVGGIRDVMGWG